VLIVRHRVNTLSQLVDTPKSFGAEIDLRSRNDELILEHDPYKQGELFDEWLSAWNGQFLVLNIKEEGLEDRIIQTLNARGVEEYFFLDQSFPFMQKLIRSGNRRVASRASDIESIQTPLNSGAEWCWLDSFSGNWNYLIEAVPELEKKGIRTCLVSPELQRIDYEVELANLRDILKKENLNLDAVCTKFPEVWA